MQEVGDNDIHIIQLYSVKVSYVWMMLSTQGHDWNNIAIGGQNSQ